MEWLYLFVVVDYANLFVFQLNKYFSDEALLGAWSSEMNEAQSLPSRNSKTSVKPCLDPVCGPTTNCDFLLKSHQITPGDSRNGAW